MGKTSLATQNNNNLVKYHDKIQNLRLLDDEFMLMVFQDNTEAVQLVICTILDRNDLFVKNYHTQVKIINTLGRSIIMDILAEDKDGSVYNIEIQRSSQQASPKRLRYHSSLIDMRCLKKNESFDALPEKYVIFIMEEDYFRQGEPLYEFVMISRKDHCLLLGDGQHLIYVNGQNRTDTKLGRLMQDFTESDPDKMYFEALKSRVKYYKTNKEGEKIMSSVIEEVYAEGKTEGKTEGRAEGRISGRTESIKSAVKYLKKTVNKSVAIKQLMGMFDLSEAAAMKYYQNA